MGQSTTVRSETGRVQFEVQLYDLNSTKIYELTLHHSQTKENRRGFVTLVQDWRVWVRLNKDSLISDPLRSSRDYSVPKVATPNLYTG